jgi:FkbM family methyltransferase
LAGDTGISIHAFEPDPLNFKMLTANLAINCPHHTVSLHQVALGDENGTLAFEINPSNAGDNRLAGSGHAAMGEDNWKRIEVQVRRLDDILGECAKPLVVKIDAQGAEAKIIIGGRNTPANADFITLEWYPYLLARVGGDPQSAIELVAGFERASMVVADQEDEPVWLSGMEVATRMRATLLENSNPEQYYEVQVKQT